MKKLIFLFTATILFCSCSTYDPEGIWQSEVQVNQQYIILKVEKDIAIRKPSSKNWAYFKNVSDNKYVNKSGSEIIQLSSADKMEVYNQEGRKISSYKRVVLQDKIDRRLITQYMTKEQVVKFLGEPKEKIVENQIEKWLYNDKLLLHFDEKGVSKMGTDHTQKADFSMIKKGMTKQEVLDIIGKPDKEDTQTLNGVSHQKWYYDNHTVLTFDNTALIDIGKVVIPTIGDGSKAALEQSFSLVDLVNDKPVGYVIEDIHKEFLNCDCKIDQDKAILSFKGEKASVNISLQGKKFTATSTYTLINSNTVINQNSNNVDLKLSTSRFEKGNKLIGFIRIENNCPLEVDGAVFPCYIKGTFDCIFK